MTRSGWLWLLLGLAGAACLRTTEDPDAWPCNTTSDCLNGNVCRLNQCVAPGTCDVDSECGQGQACVAQRCADVECSSKDATSCSGYGCTPQNTCRTSCASANDCATDYGCRDEACVPAECITGGGSCAPYRCSERVCLTSCDFESDCAGGPCVEHQCQPAPKAEGEVCQRDEECSSGVCCTRTQTGTPQCQAECTRAPLGEACAQNLDCESAACAGGKCVVCADEACVAERCGNVKCGEYAGVYCGDCGEKQACEVTVCVDVCLDRECGYDRNVLCGNCDAKEYCDGDFKCQDACGDLECGYAHDVACGSCEADEYCDSTQHCVFDCVYRDCGPSLHGANCGECPGKNYCDGDGKCQPACEGWVCGAPFGVSCGDCDEGDLCDVGACVPQICPTEHTHYCKDNQILKCNGGTSETLHMDCDDTDAFCFENWDAFRGGISCVPKCEPGTTYCYDEYAFSCGDDGIPIDERPNCTAAGLDCRDSYGCGTALPDQEFGPPCTGKTTKHAFGNVYEATKDMVLVAFGQYFQASGARFFVYEATNQAGPYEQIASVDSPYSTTTQYLTWVDVNVALEAGRFYLLGASAPSGETASFCYWNALTDTTPFGTLKATGYAAASDVPAQIQSPNEPANTRQWLRLFEPK